VKPPEVFRARFSRLLHLTRAQEAAPGERVLAPGDLEQEAARERLEAESLWRARPVLRRNLSRSAPYRLTTSVVARYRPR